MLYANLENSDVAGNGCDAVFLPINILAEGTPCAHANNHLHCHLAVATDPHNYTHTGIPAYMYAAAVFHRNERSLLLLRDLPEWLRHGMRYVYTNAQTVMMMPSHQHA